MFKKNKIHFQGVLRNKFMVLMRFKGTVAAVKDDG